MLPTIRALIAANATANGLLSGRVYRHGQAPKDVARPYVTWTFAGAPDNGFDGASHDNFRVNVDVWDDEDERAVTVGQAVRDALEPSAYCVGYSNGRDPETKRIRIGLAFDFIESR